jgi:urea transport system substrate-binding protein
MQRDLEAFNAERSLSLRMRVGVHTGSVLWGSVGGDRPTATGDAVNVAQQLESAAKPGTVLVSAATERETRDGVRYGRRGPVAGKGRGEPVEAFEAVPETK